MTVKVAPSILSSDFGSLSAQVRAAETASADWIHVDVMDGHFVPNITIGPLVTSAVRAATSLTVDVHLMIEKPDRYLQQFVEAGAHVLTVHQEACRHLHRVVQEIRDLGVSPGVAVNPATPVETLRDILPYVDLVLVMSVNPGFGGQAFIPTSVEKVARVREMIDHFGGDDVELEVDGGVDAGNARELVAAGATVLVAGSAVYRHPAGIVEGIAAIRRAGDQGARDRSDEGPS